MPKLSPEMQEGTLVRWLKQEGDRVEQYDLVCEVSTSQLVEEAYRMGDFEGSVTLLIESQEEGVLARRLADEGATLPAGVPIAVIAEGGSDSDDGGGSGGGGGGGGERARAWRPPTTNVYDESQPAVRVLEWQSYLKESKDGPSCNKCMG